MSTPMCASDRDLLALARMVNTERADVPAERGLPPSLLTDLTQQISCDVIGLAEFDSTRQVCPFVQAIPFPVPRTPDPAGAPVTDFDPVQWSNYWKCECCSYPDRSGDLRSVVGIGDFYSDRQWRSMGTQCGINRPLGFAHTLMLTLPAPGAMGASGRSLRLFLFRGPGPDFTDRDRAILTLLRPHVLESYLAAERHRHPTRRLTQRQRDLMQLVAAGHTNTQIARRLGVSEGTVRTHLEHVYARLEVSSRTAAVLRAFPEIWPDSPEAPGGGEIQRRTVAPGLSSVPAQA